MATFSTHPWQAGWRAARANFLPGLFVQGLMLTVVCAYYFWPESRPRFDQLGRLKHDWGYLYSGLSAALAGGLLPEILRLAAFQKGQFRRQNLRNLPFTMPYWAVQGIVVDCLYRWQAVWFGDRATLAVIVKKVAVDQFLYNSLFAAPVAVVCYDWKNSGYQRWPCFDLGYYRERVAPALFATWGVWIPLVTLIYALPATLQIPIFGLALTFWVMIFTWISEKEVRSRSFKP